MTTRPPRCLAALALALLPCAVAAADWPAFRGPRGDGTADERGLPLKWSEKENVVWKARLPGHGVSSPVVLGDRVLVTCYSGYGGKEKGGDMTKLRRHLVCLDRNTGKPLWQADVAARQPEVEWGGPLLQHGYATSTPATDGERVYVCFGKSGTFAFDLAGKQLWHADVGDMLNGFGSGASPALLGDLVIVNATVESGRLQGLEKATGKAVWKVRINGDCWTTPLPVKVPGGGEELVFFARGVLYGFDGPSGKQLWECDCPGPDYVSANPVARDGVVYVMGSGNAGRVCMAVKAGGRGDVTKTHVVWRQKVGASYTSPVLAGDHLYFFSNLAYCLRADTGEVVFSERLAGLGQEYSSPVAADGRIYLFTRRGKGHVFAVKDSLESLAANDLDAPDGFTASPAVSGGRIFVRSGEDLWCLGEKQ
jgi:outer membrane protein assembly factor BamB